MNFDVQCGLLEAIEEIHWLWCVQNGRLDKFWFIIFFSAGLKIWHISIYVHSGYYNEHLLVVISTIQINYLCTCVVHVVLFVSLITGMGVTLKFTFNLSSFCICGFTLEIRLHSI